MLRFDEQVTWTVLTANSKTEYQEGPMQMVDVIRAVPNRVDMVVSLLISR